MDGPPFDPPNRLRFGLGWRAAVAGGLAVVALVAATLLAHMLQWQSDGLLRRVVDGDMPRMVAASRSLVHIARCISLQDRLETHYDHEGGRQEMLAAWESEFASLRDQAKILAANDSGNDEATGEWLARLARCRGSFLDATQEIESGKLSTGRAVRAALEPSRSILAEIRDETQTLLARLEGDISASRQECQRVSVSRIRLTNVRTVIAALVIVMVVMWFRYGLVRRLGGVSALLSRVASGDCNAHIKPGSRDELGLLAMQCNDVAAAMQANQHEVQRTKNEARANYRAKSEFLAHINQEMRVALSVVSVQADLLLASPESHQRLEAAATIKHNSEYLLEIIHSLSELIRIETGDLQCDPAAFSPRQVVDEVAAVLGARAEAKGMQLLVDYESPLPQTVDTDSAWLRQVLFDLITNAIRCNEVGEVCLAVRFAEVAAERGLLEFHLTQPGAGLTEQQIMQLSNPVTNYSYTNQRASAGGLRLIVCRRLTDLLGGTIRVDGLTHGETVVVMTVPVSLPQASPSTRPAADGHCQPLRGSSQTPPRTAAEGRFRILLAEDGPENLRLMSIILRKAGAEVTAAKDGCEAVELVLGKNCDSGREPKPFDLILMDMQMPVMDGYEATRRLRENGYTGLIVAVTGHTRSFDRQKCLDAGCNDYLAKPVDREKLLALVSEHVAWQSRHGHIRL